jgi:soluble lytic murein transglycosylase-like protein
MAARLGDISPVADTACQPAPPEIREIQSPNRRIVEAWVNQIAPYYAIDPKLVMAVIQAESAFNPGALSDKNAQGLMQLIPATAERFRVKDVWNPVENIKGGTAYLHWLMRHFAGNVEWVLAAYNAGEGAVERYQGVPPYEETRSYVKRILARYQKTAHPIPPELSGEATTLEHTKLVFAGASQPVNKN